MQALWSYLRQKCLETSTSQLSDLLSPESTAHVGLILTERLINIPTEVVPPMYTMLLEEISWAIEEKEPYRFSHYLILSKTYTEMQSSLEQSEVRLSKKTKTSKNKREASQTFYFHPEDEVLQKHAMEHTGFEYTRHDLESVPDSKRAFQELGIRPQGHMILIEQSEFENAVKSVRQFITGSS